MAEQPFVVYDHAMEFLMDGTIDTDSDTFNVLYLDSSYTPSTVSDSRVSSIVAGELSASDGTTLRQTLANVTWTRAVSSGVSVVRFDADDVTMSTSSTVKVRYAAIYSDTATNDELLCFSELTTTGTGVPVTQLTLQFNAVGIFKLKRA